jgi:DNA-binding GntR family transcriptional regulator
VRTSHAFEPAETPTLGDSVADALRAAILSGRIGPGERLVEAELARELRVSRGPVREALALLAREGIVVSIPRHGKFVQGFTPRLIDELYSLRMVLEPYAASRVIARLDDAAVKRLDAALAAIAAAVADDDERTLAQCDIGFHHLICELADHDLLMRAWQENIAGKLGILLSITTRTLSALRDAERQHRRLLDPIVAGDETQARARLEEHIAEAADRARHALWPQEPRSARRAVAGNGRGDRGAGAA